MGSKNGKPVLHNEDIAQLSKSSGLDEDGVREAFAGFVAKHPDGKMKVGDFREIMTTALPKKDVSKIEKHVFRIYDANNDGSVDFVEFMVVFFILSEGEPTDVLGKLFNLFDVDRNGTITRKEMDRLVRDMYGLITRGDPTIAAKASEDLIANSAFAEMDKDEDGKISVDEFKDACLKEEAFSKMLSDKALDIFMDE
eukprot:TRINITY_DN34540_c0_g1_i1.p1 TRINITY_DN34540_c0_g1~~TRINITY_DN34540_c0_g1_i1.p1  ORF type:complete len:197 (+),score=69.49 TRINITY_DN34540_c0_g1_i1:69-659(+)